MDRALVSEYLTLVLPWDDTSSFKSIWMMEQGREGAWGYVGTTLDELIRIVAIKDRDENINIYAALGSQRHPKADDPAKPNRKWKKSSRVRENVVSFKSIFIDIDAGTKGYPNTIVAKAALQKFCADTHLPAPNVQVLSGSGGMHVYWTFEKAIPLQRWQPLAQALVHAVRRHALICDEMCTTDASRILRIPSTRNWKGGAPVEVRMYQPTAPFPIEVIEEILKPYAGPRLVNEKAGTKPELSEMAKRFTAGLDELTQAPPVDLFEIAEAGCLVLDEALQTGGREHKQPLWNLLMLAATFDKEPVDTAHALSLDYPTYDPAEVEGMLARKQSERQHKDMGWPTCEAFARESTLCQSCQFYGKIRSPLNIATLVASASQQSTTSPTPHDDLPTGYWRDGHTGRIMTHVERGQGAKKFTVAMHVCNNPLWAAELDDETRDLRCKTLIADEESYVAVPRDSLSDTRTFASAMLRSNLFPSIERIPLARDFFMAWMDKLNGTKQARFTSDVLGWNDERSAFTYGDITFRVTGERDKAFARARYDWYTPKGELTVWTKAAKMLTDQHRPALDAILASSFAAPLVALVDMPGLMFSAVSQRSGVGKSTALKIAQAVWGHPVKGVNSLGDTANSIAKKLIDMQSFPLYWDELKMKKEIDQFVDLIFRLGQGRGKSRLTRTLEQQEPGSFQTMIVGCSNESIAEAVTSSVANTDAGANRVFEIQVATQDPSLNYPGATMAYAVGDLDRNYGRAGEIYAAFLATNRDAFVKAVRSQQERLYVSLKATPGERFWVAILACLLTGAFAANHLKLTDIDAQGLSAFLIDTFHEQRRNRSSNLVDFTEPDAIDTLLDRLMSSTRGKNMIVTAYVHQSAGRPMKANTFDHTELMRMQEIWAQFGREDDTLRVKREQLRAWLREQGWQYGVFIKAMKQHSYHFNERKATIGAGIVGLENILDRKQVPCVDITIPSSVTSAPGSSSSS